MFITASARLHRGGPHFGTRALRRHGLPQVHGLGRRWSAKHPTGLRRRGRPELQVRQADPRARLALLEAFGTSIPCRRAGDSPSRVVRPRRAGGGGLHPARCARDVVDVLQHRRRVPTLAGGVALAARRSAARWGTTRSRAKDLRAAAFLWMRRRRLVEQGATSSTCDELRRPDAAREFVTRARALQQLNTRMAARRARAQEREVSGARRSRRQDRGQQDVVDRHLDLARAERPNCADS